MPTSCVAYGCTQRHQKGNEISFFSFPVRQPDKLAKWIHAVKRKNFQPKSSDRLCSLHFKHNDYILSPGSKYRVLKPGAIPSIFEAFSEHLKPKETRIRKSRNIVQEENPEEVCEVECFEEIQTSTNTVHTASEIENTVLDELKKLKRTNRIMTQRISSLERKCVKMISRIKLLKVETKPCKLVQATF